MTTAANPTNNNDDGSKRIKTTTMTTAPPPPPLRVCVIGGGPAAMFFCHSYNQQKKQRQSMAASSSNSSYAQEEPLQPKGGGEEEEGQLQVFQELDITCFEMKSTPGGIWRLPLPSSSTNNNNDEEDDQVYDELWTNAPAQNWEFYDYTFDDHFGVGVGVGGDDTKKTTAGSAPTMFLPRRDVNEYITQRVIKNHATFFDEYFVCNTKVESVKEIIDDNDMDDDKVVGTRFSVTVRHLPTNIATTQTFDRCIWAAGENCNGYIPKSIQDMFPNTTTTTSSSGRPDDAVLLISEVGDVDKENKEEDTDDHPPIPSSIRLLHSSETHRIREYCPGRKVLLIGAELSAEDLALQCLKWGACHVDVTARTYGAVSWTSQWPGNKVDVHLYTEIDSVQGNTVTLKFVDSTWLGYERYVRKDDDDGYDDIILNDIHLVVACTGYEVNLAMLDVALRPQCGIIPRYNAHPQLVVTNDEVDWSKWKMKSNHNAYKITGDIPAGQERMLRSNYNHPDLYRGVSLKNPHMIYLCEHGSEFPLLSLDIHAWLACSYLTGTVPQPSVDVMKKANMDQFLDQLHYPVIRRMSDEAYAKIINLKSLEYYGESDDESSSSEDESNDEDELSSNEDEVKKSNVMCGSRDLHLLLQDKTAGLDFSEYVNPYDFDHLEYDLYMIRLTCKVMEEGKYPGKCLGNYEGLNEYGLRLVRHNFIDVRGCLSKAEYAKDVEWRTYRDTDITITKSIKSLYTGTPARPLNKRWMDIKEGRFASIKNNDA